METKTKASKSKAKKSVSATRAMKHFAKPVPSDAYAIERAKREAETREGLRQVGFNAYAALAEMIEGLRKAREDEDDKAIESAEQSIQEDPLSIEVSHGWHAPGANLSGEAPEAFRILLGTGGPAVRLAGDLDQYGQPKDTRLEVQDWGTPWTEYRLIRADDAPFDHDMLDEYARCFYFGEG